MKNGNEWVSIGDFMAGIVGVLVLFFVVAALISFSSQRDKQMVKQKGAAQVIGRLQKIVLNNKDLKGIDFKPQTNTMILNDSSFSQGSACLNPNLQKVFGDKLSDIIITEMKNNRKLAVQIEGHTDNVEVHGVSANIYQLCAPFDDNYTLSAGRAREARKALFPKNKLENTNVLERVSVVGYGPDRLINKSNPNAPENRRVEIKFISEEN